MSGRPGNGEMVEPPEIPGIVHLRSSRRASETADRLAEIVRAKGLTVFARFDFSHDATTVGLTLLPTIQLVFGNPRSGTPLMVANQLAGLVLPLRALAWEDADGHGWLSYETPATVIERFHLPEELLANVAGLRALCEAAVA